MGQVHAFITALVLELQVVPLKCCYLRKKGICLLIVHCEQSVLIEELRTVQLVFVLHLGVISSDSRQTGLFSLVQLLA